MQQPDLVSAFTAGAEAVSSTVRTVQSTEEAFRYTLRVCREKEACQLLASGCEEPLSDPARDLCELKEYSKIIAACGLAESELESLLAMCRSEGIALIDRGLRAHLGGIDIGLTHALYGIASSGTLVVDSRSEDLRLATMISEIHVAMLSASSIYPDADALQDALRERMLQGPDYTSFITGPSRTADIERVLTLGVHGPLELYVLITP
jgi:L-lactate dehydrogenase complex protein LldG